MTASRGRMALAWTLVGIGILLAVLAVIAGYVRYQALDTPTVEETATKMIEDDDVREADRIQGRRRAVHEGRRPGRAP